MEHVQSRRTRIHDNVCCERTFMESFRGQQSQLRVQVGAQKA